MKYSLLSLLFATAAASQATWLPQLPSTSPREGHNLVYDPATQRAFVLWGIASGGYALGFWMWDGAAWTPATLTPPAIVWNRYNAGCCDEGTGSMIAFGGYRAGFGPSFPQGATDEMWRVTASSAGALQFVALQPSPRPFARQGLAMTLTNQGVLLFGGGSSSLTSLLGDTWRWNGTGWSQLASGPTARVFAAMAFDSTRNVTVLFGGAMGAAVATGNDTWEFDGTTWQQRSPAQSPPPRCRAAFAYSPVVGKCVLFGGGNANGSGNLADAWTWDGTNWQQLVATGPAPAARQGAALTYDAAQQRVLLFGGRDVATATYFDDSYYLDVQSSPSTYTPFGAGCVGPNNVVPSLAAAPSEVPSLGSTSHLVAGNLPVGNLTLPVFVLGLSNTFEPNPGYPLPFDLGIVGWPGCQQLVSHEIFNAVPTLAGTVTLPFTVPYGVNLIGFTFHVQVLVLYTPTGAAVSNGITGLVGT